MTQVSAKVEIEVLNPVAGVQPKLIVPARRLNDFHGKKIALWWNTKSHGEVALSAAAEAISQLFKDVTFTRFTQDFPHGEGVYDVVQKSQCDAVVASTGD
ncbi:MAG: hypothetical protein HYX92_15625 [Chloroflexi bacterium]|nr:hypothetical protein [Chloroflexota bacterium]